MLPIIARNARPYPPKSLPAITQNTQISGGSTVFLVQGERASAVASFSAARTRWVYSSSCGLCEKASLNMATCAGWIAKAPAEPSRRACAAASRSLSLSENSPRLAMKPRGSKPAATGKQNGKVRCRKKFAFRDIANRGTEVFRTHRHWHVHPIGDGIEQGHLNSGPLPSDLPMIQRLKYGAMCCHACRDVANRHPYPGGPVLRTGDRTQTSFGLHDEIIGLEMGKWPLPKLPRCRR